MEVVVMFCIISLLALPAQGSHYAYRSKEGILLSQQSETPGLRQYTYRGSDGLLYVSEEHFLVGGGSSYRLPFNIPVDQLEVSGGRLVVGNKYFLIPEAPKRLRISEEYYLSKSGQMIHVLAEPKPSNQYVGGHSSGSGTYAGGYSRGSGSGGGLLAAVGGLLIATSFLSPVPGDEIVAVSVSRILSRLAW